MKAAHVLLVLLLPSLAQARPGVFSLDDNPAMPLTSPPGVIPGFGAENPYGLAFITPPPGYAPSPTLPAVPPPPWGVAPGALDAGILWNWPMAPIPMTHLRPLGPAYIDGLSAGRVRSARPLSLEFSVDRISMGAPGTALAVEAACWQQAGDIYRGTRVYNDPGMFAGMLPLMGGPGFVGLLPTAGGGGGNNLIWNQHVFGLTAVGAPGVPTWPGMPTPPPVPGQPMKDNIDAYEREQLDLNGDGITDTWLYASINPDQALISGGPSPNLAAAAIYDLPPGMGGLVPNPYATAFTLGLDMMQGPNADNIDDLIVWDNGALGGPAWGGPGAQPGLDYALFSLSPGSMSLAQWGLSPGDIFFTDFTGRFAVFALAADLGLGRNMLGLPDNVDGLTAAIYLEGDADTDGDVDFADYQKLETNFGRTGKSWPDGDFDGDGDVDFADYQKLETNFGRSIPEPSVLALLALGLAGAIRRRR